MEEADVLTEAELRSVLDTKWLGKEVEYFYETDSTNNRARDAAEKGASHGYLAVADCQTAGKGRRGRVWNSPHGTDIFMSFLMRPSFEPAQASMLTLVAGMAVVKGVQKATGLNAMIKWPNDAVVNGKKDLRYFNGDEYRRRYHPLCGGGDRNQCKCKGISGGNPG